jgi:hypothetical protein
MHVSASACTRACSLNSGRTEGEIEERDSRDLVPAIKYIVQQFKRGFSTEQHLPLKS